MTKWRDLNPFETKAEVCSSEGYVRDYYFVHKEWVYFLPKDIAIPMWKINRIVWRVAVIGLFITGIILAMV